MCLKQTEGVNSSPHFSSAENEAARDLVGSRLRGSCCSSLIISPQCSQWSFILWHLCLCLQFSSYSSLEESAELNLSSDSLSTSLLHMSSEGRGKTDYSSLPNDDEVLLLQYICPFRSQQRQFHSSKQFRRWRRQRCECKRTRLSVTYPNRLVWLLNNEMISFCPVYVRRSVDLEGLWKTDRN